MINKYKAMPILKKCVSNSLGSRPVLVDFQNSRIKPEQNDNFEGNVYTCEGKHLVGITTPNMLYTNELRGDEYYNNFLLIHNKTTNEIESMQIDQVIVCPVTQTENQLDVLSKSETSVSELNKQFGSKKTKRLTEQRERLTMDIEAVKDQLEKTVSGVHIDESITDGALSEHQSIYRPKINREASTRDGVYNSEDLVPTFILSTLENDALAIINGSGQEGLTQFVSNSIHQVLNSNISHEMMVRKINLFLYINYLIKFINTPIKMFTKKFTLCSSVEVSNHILDNFSVKGSTGGRTRPLYMKDKSLCFLVVLAALALDYEVDLASLSKDCKIGVKKALEISRILAFNASAKNKNVVTLNLPLPAPISFSPKKRRR